MTGIDSCRRMIDASSVYIVASLVVIKAFTEAAGVKNPCIRNDTPSPKVWGHTCENPCHCKDDTACDSRGYCPKGCASGFILSRTGGRCVKKHNKINKLESEASNTETNTDEEMDDADTTLYRFVPSKECIRDSGKPYTYRRSWSIKTKPPIFIHKINLVFEIMPHSDDDITVEFRTELFPNDVSTVSFREENRKVNSDELSISVGFTIADTILITDKMADPSEDCTPARIAAVIVYGQPICPYRKWGTYCQEDCQCPCRVAECHPSTGNCFKRGFACPPRLYGPLCNLECSTACSGNRQECHVLFSTCKECSNVSYTGPHCENLLTSSEIEARTKTCERDEDFGKSVQRLRVSSNSTSDFFEDDMQNSLSVVIAVTIGILLAILILGCCAYVSMVKRCAKTRMRKQMASLEEERKRGNSMMSYTEFKKEFVEMQGSLFGMKKRSVGSSACGDDDASFIIYRVAQQPLNDADGTNVDPSPKGKYKKRVSIAEQPVTHTHTI